MRDVMNSYDIFNEENYSTVLYHAVARDEEEVRELAVEHGIDIDGLKIELCRRNVRDELGRPFRPFIENALVD